MYLCCSGALGYPARLTTYKTQSFKRGYPWKIENHKRDCNDFEGP